MGHQARVRAERRAAAVRATSYARGAGRDSVAVKIMRALHQDVLVASGETPRRAWELMVEMLAHSSGWNTETNESGHIRLANEERFAEFAEAWADEVEACRAAELPFSEPLGEILLEIDGHGGRNIPPMDFIFEQNLAALASAPDVSGRAGTIEDPFTALDPFCATGRNIIDALVRYPNVHMRGVDFDLWLLRAAMVNVRYLAKWTTLTVASPAAGGTGMAAFDDASERRLVEQGVLREDSRGELRVVGGRAFFMYGDAGIVDLEYDGNWLSGLYSWTPRRWESNLKVRGAPFTWDQLQQSIATQEAEENARLLLGGGEQKIRFDFSTRRGP